MNCSDFVTRFSEYVDGTASSSEMRAMDEHLTGCASCSRYRTVVEHGAQLLRSLPAPELRDDFEPRLQHRLFHVHEERLSSDAATSRTPALTVLGIAVVLAAVAWSPVLRGSAPEVELAPIVVDRAPSPVRIRLASVQARGALEIRRVPDLEADLWDDTRLYEYSPLSRRYDSDLRFRTVAGVVPP